ncbi:MAG: hypothetical protein PHE73_04395 [Sulfurovaceae bacterium]|nr:hypothetical protein [Sulfurovaceae bacterium]
MAKQMLFMMRHKEKINEINQNKTSVYYLMTTVLSREALEN